jgi:type II secretory pathway pseudopilin PulG
VTVPPPAQRPARARGGFSVVELLVVIGILIAIISSLVVGLGFAARKARIANTEFLMNSVAIALTKFNADVGYFPPVLASPFGMPGGTGGTPIGTFGWARDVVRPRQLPPQGTPASAPDYDSWSPDDFRGVQAWCSNTSLVEYLVGPGDRSQDGYGVILTGAGAFPTDTTTPGFREQPANGIRDPGADGAWGAFSNPRGGQAADGSYRSRNLAAINLVSGAGDPVVGNRNQVSSAQSIQFLRGKSIGPYLDLSSGIDIAGMTGFDGEGVPVVARPGESGYSEALPKVLLDYFGKPILYYRRPYIGDDPTTVDRRCNLADVIALRPQVILPGEEAVGCPESLLAGGSAEENRSVRAAVAAEFALFSFGPDTRWNPFRRADPDGYNEDNIVRFGP